MVYNHWASVFDIDSRSGICYLMNDPIRKIALGFMADSFFLIRGQYFFILFSIKKESPSRSGPGREIRAEAQPARCRLNTARSAASAFLPISSSIASAA